MITPSVNNHSPLDLNYGAINLNKFPFKFFVYCIFFTIVEWSGFGHKVYGVERLSVAVPIGLDLKIIELLKEKFKEMLLGKNWEVYKISFIDYIPYIDIKLQNDQQKKIFYQLVFKIIRIINGGSKEYQNTIKNFTFFLYYLTVELQLNITESQKEKFIQVVLILMNNLGKIEDNTLFVKQFEEDVNNMSLFNRENEKIIAEKHSIKMEKLIESINIYQLNKKIEESINQSTNNAIKEKAKFFYFSIIKNIKQINTHLNVNQKTCFFKSIIKTIELKKDQFINLINIFNSLFFYLEKILKETEHKNKMFEIFLKLINNLNKIIDDIIFEKKIKDAEKLMDTFSQEHTKTQDIENFINEIININNINADNYDTKFDELMQFEKLTASEENRTNLQKFLTYITIDIKEIKKYLTDEQKISFLKSLIELIRGKLTKQNVLIKNFSNFLLVFKSTLQQYAQNTTNLNSFIEVIFNLIDNFNNIKNNKDLENQIKKAENKIKELINRYAELKTKNPSAIESKDNIEDLINCIKIFIDEININELKKILSDLEKKDNLKDFIALILEDVNTIKNFLKPKEKTLFFKSMIEFMRKRQDFVFNSIDQGTLFIQEQFEKFSSLLFIFTETMKKQEAIKKKFIESFCYFIDNLNKIKNQKDCLELLKKVEETMDNDSAAITTIFLSISKQIEVQKAKIIEQDEADYIEEIYNEVLKDLRKEEGQLILEISKQENPAQNQEQSVSNSPNSAPQSSNPQAQQQQQPLSQHQQNPLAQQIPEQNIGGSFNQSQHPPSSNIPVSAQQQPPSGNIPNSGQQQYQQQPQNIGGSASNQSQKPSSPKKKQNQDPLAQKQQQKPQVPQNQSNPGQHQQQRSQVTQNQSNPGQQQYQQQPPSGNSPNSGQEYQTRQTILKTENPAQNNGGSASNSAHVQGSNPAKEPQNTAQAQQQPPKVQENPAQNQEQSVSNSPNSAPQSSNPQAQQQQQPLSQQQKQPLAQQPPSSKTENQEQSVSKIPVSAQQSSKSAAPQGSTPSQQQEPSAQQPQSPSGQLPGQFKKTQTNYGFSAALYQYNQLDSQTKTSEDDKKPSSETPHYETPKVSSKNSPITSGEVTPLEQSSSTSLNFNLKKIEDQQMTKVDGSMTPTTPKKSTSPPGTMTGSGTAIGIGTPSGTGKLPATPKIVTPPLTPSAKGITTPKKSTTPPGTMKESGPAIGIPSGIGKPEKSPKTPTPPITFGKGTTTPKKSTTPLGPMTGSGTAIGIGTPSETGKLPATPKIFTPPLTPSAKGITTPKKSKIPPGPMTSPGPMTGSLPLGLPISEPEKPEGTSPLDNPDKLSDLPNQKDLVKKSAAVDPRSRGSSVTYLLFTAGGITIITVPYRYIGSYQRTIDKYLANLKQMPGIGKTMDLLQKSMEWAKGSFENFSSSFGKRPPQKSIQQPTNNSKQYKIQKNPYIDGEYSEATSILSF